MTCLRCESGSYVYRLGGDCHGCTARWIARMPERERVLALAKQEPAIRERVAELLAKQAGRS